MKNFIIYLKSVFLLAFICIIQNLQAQCPAIVTAFISSQTTATCPSNATINIGSNANGVATATYQAIVAPSGVSLAAQSSNIFTSLPPGNYTFRVACGSSVANVNATITSTYTQLTANTVTSNICIAFVRGGTITVTPSGGTLPYSYSIIKTTNANYSDAMSVYGDSNILNPTDSGIFQVRIKDGCGNFITKTVNIQPTIPAIHLVPDYLDNDQPCGSGNVRMYYDLQDALGASINSDDLPFGYRIDIYTKGVGCTRGAFVKTVNKNQGSTDRMIIPTNQDIYIKVTNSCGDTTSSCYTFSVGSIVFETHWQVVQTGCASVAHPNGLLNVALEWNDNGRGPELYSVIKLDGSVVRTPTADSTIFQNLLYDTYVIVAQDACGLIDKDTLVPPTVGEPVSFSDWDDYFCTNQTGTLTYHGEIRGFIYDMEHAVITIVSGPSNVGAQAIYDSQLAQFYWPNMLPGNYVANILTGCGSTLVNFSIDPSEITLVQDFSVNVQQICNNGGIINSVLNYNGGGSVTFELYDNLNALVSNNSSGVFTNIPQGNYIIKAKIQPEGNCFGGPYTIDKPVTILPNGAPPQISKKIAMICEDVSGNPISNGKAILRSFGFAPFNVEIKRVIEPDANYVFQYSTLSNDFTIDNLIPNENYRIRITDQCGNTALTDVSTGILEQLAPIQNGNPCIGEFYTLSAPDMINASYSWQKSSTIVGTSREIVFPIYNSSNDGAYTCTISIGGGCVNRTVNNILGGVNCSVLPITIEEISVNVSNCKSKISFKINNTTPGMAKIDLQISSDGNSFEAINNISINVNGTIEQSFIDNNPNKGINYYRLVITEPDGRKIISKIVSLRNNCTDTKSSFTAYPNPIVNNNDLNINIISTVFGNAEISLINEFGQLISKKIFVSKIGVNSSHVGMDKVKSGIYYVSIILSNGEKLIQKIIKY